MIRGLLRLILLVVVVAVVGAYLLGWRWNGRVYHIDRTPAAVGTTGIDAAKARAVGAEVGDRTAQAAEKTREVARAAGEQTAKAAGATRRAIEEGSLTAKIKAKMALDDHVKALDLNVDTVGSVVTVSGSVNTEAERQRALALARDTQGVTQVIDRLQVNKR
jgi:osmotically-inducible protein OsmY